MSAPPKPVFDFDALLEEEPRSEVRRQYIRGQFFPMHGTVRHAEVNTNLSVAVGVRLRGHACHGTSGHQRLRVSETSEDWYYADLTIVCSRERYHPRDKNALLSPSAIFEVLSPETEKFDRTGKFDEFKAIPELSDYILIDTELARVEHFVRLESGQWAQSVYTRLDQELKLENFGISVPMSEIYEDVEVGEQGVLPIMLPEIE